MLPLQYVQGSIGPPKFKSIKIKYSKLNSNIYITTHKIIHNLLVKPSKGLVGWSDTFKLGNGIAHRYLEDWKRNRLQERKETNGDI